MQMVCCDNCGFEIDGDYIYVMEDGEKGLCPECAFKKDYQQLSENESV